MSSPNRWLTASAAVVLSCIAVEAAPAYVTLMDNGPSSNRVGMVFLGEGYTADEIQTKYVPLVDQVMRVFSPFPPGDTDYGWKDPYLRYRNFFNVYRIDVVSNESGVDEPDKGIYRDTALDGRRDPPDGLLYISQQKAGAILNKELVADGIRMPQARLVAVNSLGRGRSDSAFALFFDTRLCPVSLQWADEHG